MKKLTLNNEIPIVLKENKNTPRIAVCFYLKIDRPETKAGEYTLLNRLFTQGTKKRTAEELAQELDENAIDCYSEMKHDFIRFKVLCLNEDIEKGLEILSDILQNSTLEDFEKEKVKLKGEIGAEMDSPKSKAVDAFYRNLYEGHCYGNTYTKILEELDSITIEDVKNSYKEILENSVKVISAAGDFEQEHLLGLFNKYFEGINKGESKKSCSDVPTLNENKIIKLEKEDAAQAQIIMGWHCPTIYSEDYPVIMLLNTILGSSGLSSRLFVELRDKKGLAYVVRSSYEIFDHSANFSVYIATEPKNIQTSLDMFKVELDKIKTIPVSEQELENAKNNLIGKREFFTETNLQQASLIAFYEDKKLGYDFEKELLEKIKKVSIQDIQKTADKYIKDPYVLTILAPKKCLEIK